MASSSMVAKLKSAGVTQIPDGIAEFVKQYPHMTTLPKEMEDESKAAIELATAQIRDVVDRTKAPGPYETPIYSNKIFQFR